MNQSDQQEIMLRFSRCQYADREASYERCDCVGAVRLVLRDYGGVVELPDDVTEWADRFEMLSWPTELQDLDVLLLQLKNSFGLADHMAVHIGNRYIVHIGKNMSGVMCERVNRYESKIVNVARYRR